MIRCVLCRVEIEERESHNAEPITDGRCCTACNCKFVIPARIKQWRSEMIVEKQEVK